MVQQKTLALPSATSTRTGTIDVAAIVQRARTTYGTEPTVVPTVKSGQRELVDLQVDCSGSMAEAFDGDTSKIEAASRAGVNLVLHKHRIDSMDEIGVTTFTSSARLRLDFGPVANNKPRIIECLQSLDADGGTDLEAPLRLRSADFAWDRQDVVRRIVMLTDGHGGDPEKSAAALKQRGVLIDVIAIGPSPNEVNEEVLRKIASPGQYRFVRDQRTLVQHYTQLANKTAISVRS